MQEFLKGGGGGGSPQGVGAREGDVPPPARSAEAFEIMHAKLTTFHIHEHVQVFF